MMEKLCRSLLALGLLIIVQFFDECQGQRFLAVANGQLHLNGEKVFMSGMNLAWHNFGMDFGNGRYDCCTGQVLEDYLQRISAAGGNSLRVWVHCDGYSTPAFDGNGYVTSTDAGNTMLQDMSRFLDVAKQYNILVFFVLWNGATMPSGNNLNLFWDESKLDSYIQNALLPLVSGLTDKTSLGGWEIINEPEGLVFAGQVNANPCFDTTPLAGSGAGWVGSSIPMENLQRFINRQTAAIKTADNKVIVTLGSWTERAQTDRFGYRNYYTDQCLIAAGGMGNGVIDLQQMHTYAWAGQYSDTSPVNLMNFAFGLDKPNLIGELSQEGGDGRDITTMYDWAYDQGYSGVWSWQANGGGQDSDSFENQARALQHLRYQNDQNRGGRVAIVLQ